MKLASVQKILNIQPIDGADLIEKSNSIRMGYCSKKGGI